MNFESGITVVLEKSTLSDPATTWAEIAAQDENHLSRVESVRGVVALITEPQPGVARGGVELAANGMVLKVAGDESISIEDLKEVMESLRS